MCIHDITIIIMISKPHKLQAIIQLHKIYAIANSVLKHNNYLDAIVQKLIASHGRQGCTQVKCSINVLAYNF